MASAFTAVSDGDRGGLRHPALLGVWCVVAAFGAYACKYGFRKPFTAGGYTEAPFGPGMKGWLITAQILGYTASKMLGIRVIAAMRPALRARAILVLIAVAQGAWILFGLLPPPWGVACLFLNAMPRAIWGMWR